MEKKTIGGFIAVLRKANGMTQKELAEILNISDKTVSRWERDESTPDLALIPVIADLFHVTTDELLRGEKRAQDVPNNEQPKGKSIKQVERIIKNARTKILQKSFAVLAISMIGFIAAMICNFGFYRAKIGFFVASVFYVVAIVCESIFFVGAWNSMNGDEFSGDKIEDTKNYFINLLEKVIEVTLILFAATLPLVSNPAYIYTDYGILFVTELFYGLFYAFTAFIICTVIRWKINGKIISKKVVAETTEVEKHYKDFSLKIKYIAILLIIMMITFIGQLFIQYRGEKIFMSGTKFDNYEDFKSYMETPITNEGVQYEIDGESDYQEEIIEDENGNVLCKYVPYNESIVSIEYGGGDDDLPITVYTAQDWENLNHTLDNVKKVFGIIYLLEIAGVFIRFMTVKKKLLHDK